MTPERHSDLVSRILAPNPSMMTLDGTNSYLVGRDELVVIDPGPDIPEHIEAIVDSASRMGRLTLSLVTHHHGDHLPAALRLRERLGTGVAGHQDLPGVNRPLAHDERVAVGPVRLRALHTPGHTADHVCYFLEQEQALFTGDLIAGLGTVVVGDGRGDLVDYMASLSLIGELAAARIYPGHGPIVRDPAAKIREYVEHREQRERQVVAALSDGPVSVRGIVERIYTDTPAALVDMAARNVRAHLYKLEREGRAAPRGDVWEVRGERVGAR